MKKTAVFILLILLVAPVFAACASPAATAPPASGGPDGMPARPGSGATYDPSAHLLDLVDVSGSAKEVKEDLVLLTTEDGEFMLRFTENTKWDENVSRDIKVGSKLACRVKLEPTFTTPSQGEVFLVTYNK